MPNITKPSRESRCLLCDFRLGGNNDRHHWQCIAAGLPVDLCAGYTGNAFAPSAAAGRTLDYALHSGYTRRVSGPANTRLLNTLSCLQCAVPALIAKVPVGNERHADLTFILHGDGCRLMPVPASWVLALGRVHGRVPDGLLDSLLPGDSSLYEVGERVRNAAARVSAYVPRLQKLCVLCAMPITATDPSSDHHQENCLAGDDRSIAFLPTPGMAIDR